MLLDELDAYFKQLMNINDLVNVDNSLNGIQVDRAEKDIHRVAFAVDACAETFRRAVEKGADLLFVHHGLFWGESIKIINSHYKRLKYLFENDLCLYASHLPLDMHPEFGNNAVMAAALDLQKIEPFGTYKGIPLGYKGILRQKMTIDEVLETLSLDRAICAAVLPFGIKENSSVGIVSGRATREISQAIEQRLDLYITGEASHEIYHLCLEEGINVISGGHYQTETWGVTKLAERLQKDTGLETIFLDVPSGL